MVKKLVLIAVAMVVVAGFISCDLFGGTGVKGKLIIEPGQTGDVRNARVELYEKSDLTGDPVKYAQSESGGIDETEAEFEITDVLAGYYYLLAWKDIDGDGDISDGDLVGVYDGTYTLGEGGQQLTIEDGKMVDAGNISMRIFVEPVAVVASGEIKTDWEGDPYVDYSYTFNKDVTLSSVYQSDPDFPDPYLIEGENGTRTGGQTYIIQEFYWWDGYDYYVPRGTHTLRFQGSDADGSFDLTVNFTI